jgi:hypothetical protein
MTSAKHRFPILLVALVWPITVLAAPGAFLDSLKNNSEIASTVPRNGDVNPYGIAVVPATVGSLIQGHVLISNFNNRKNLQGLGTTIVDVSPEGSLHLFAQIDAKKLPGACPGGIGLTTALAVLRKGWVIVGSLPTADGSSATAQAGCLLVLDSNGNVVETFSGGMINGPWDMAAIDEGDRATLFVANVLNGTVAAGGNIVNGGTIVRIGLSVLGNSAPAETSETMIGSGFPEQTDPNALVIGPTGLGISGDTLYVADTINSAIDAIPKATSRTNTAGTGTLISSGGALNGPLGLAIAPNGNLLTANAGDGNMVETTPNGRQLAMKGVDSSGFGGGTLFGLAIAPGGTGVYFVNDGNNTMNLLH